MYNVKIKANSPFAINNQREGSQKVEYRSDQNNFLEATFLDNEVDTISIEGKNIALLAFVGKKSPVYIEGGTNILLYDGVITNNFGQKLEGTPLESLRVQLCQPETLHNIIVANINEQGKLEGKLRNLYAPRCEGMKTVDIEVENIEEGLKLDFGQSNENVCRIRCNATGEGNYIYSDTENSFKEFLLESNYDFPINEGFASMYSRSQKITLIDTSQSGIYLTPFSANAAELTMHIKQPETIMIFTDIFKKHADATVGEINLLDIELENDNANTFEALINAIAQQTDKFPTINHLSIVSQNGYDQPFFKSTTPQNIATTICYFKFSALFAGDLTANIVGVRSFIDAVIANHQTPRNLPQRTIDFSNIENSVFAAQEVIDTCTTLSTLISPNTDGTPSDYWTIQTPEGRYYNGEFIPEKN